MSRRAFLTGATGFIGSRLARRLVADGWTVHLLTRGPAGATIPHARGHHYTGATGEVVAAVEQARPDIVFHLASLYLADHRTDQVDDLVTSNILLTAQLAEALAARGRGRLINTGTAWQHYGVEAYNPVNLYAATKQAASDLLRFYHQARDLSVLTLKLFDTYGAGDTRRKLVQLLVEAAISGEALSMSPGEQMVDMTHVDDVVDAFVAAAARLMTAPEPVEEEFFVSGERLTVCALAARVERATGTSIKAEFGGRPYRAREVMMPIEAGDRLVPGWSPGRTIENYVAELLEARADERITIG